MDRNPVAWFEIYVRDMARAKAFYEAVLHIRLQTLPAAAADVDEIWAFPMEQGGAGAAGALVLMEGGPAGGGASTIVYFTTENCATVLERVVAHGGSIKKNKTSIGQYGFIALAQDSEGNVIGLHSMK
jgi:predicted enzyme related to lactoylglutathione lyase